MSLLLGRPGFSSSDAVLTDLSSTSLGLPAAVFPTQPRFLFAFSAARTHCWSMFLLVSAWFLVCKAVFQPAYPPYILVNRVCLHLTFLKCVRLLSACFSGLSNFSYMAMQLSGVSNMPSIFILYEKLLSVSSSRSLLKTFNTLDPLDMLLVNPAGFHASETFEPSISAIFQPILLSSYPCNASSVLL